MGCDSQKWGRAKKTEGLTGQKSRAVVWQWVPTFKEAVPPRPPPPPTGVTVCGERNTTTIFCFPIFKWDFHWVSIKLGTSTYLKKGLELTIPWNLLCYFSADPVFNLRPTLYGYYHKNTELKETWTFDGWCLTTSKTPRALRWKDCRALRSQVKKRHFQSMLPNLWAIWGVPSPLGPLRAGGGGPQCGMSILRHGNATCLCRLFSQMSHVKF